MEMTEDRSLHWPGLAVPKTLRRPVSFCLLFFAATVASTMAQPFVNLDFELAKTNNASVFPNFAYPSGDGKTSDLLPGWTIGAAGLSYEFINLNRYAIGSGALPEAGVWSRNAITFIEQNSGEYLSRVL